MQPGPGNADGYLGRDGRSARNSQWAIPLRGMIAWIGHDLLDGSAASYIPAVMLTRNGSIAVPDKDAKTWRGRKPSAYHTESGGNHEFAVETGSQPCRVMQPSARVSFTRTYERVM